ncbi:hypothetical protein LJY25_14600 [Hymenobacter sp. BT175]|uniref:hypothetical protein n=1 Tax=Hymenobacter translucens TaxID=2886507 RepID=UPI001D0E24C7|nr:hypothetical protein [Hymenobacter translucens]MCC2547682.1 hypothetical protein [Hymenobacter translucens]
MTADTYRYHLSAYQRVRDARIRLSQLDLDAAAALLEPREAELRAKYHQALDEFATPTAAACEAQRAGLSRMNR